MHGDRVCVLLKNFQPPSDVIKEMNIYLVKEDYLVRGTPVFVCK